jgi:hypothetical protein
MEFVERNAGLGNDKTFVSIDLFERGKYKKGIEREEEMGG